MKSEKRNLPIFYIYEHRHPETGACFWVGKGHGNRAYDGKRRNKYYQKIVAEIRHRGLSVAVEIIKSDLMETDAFSLEIERISYLRYLGEPLCNISTGGHGASGTRHSEESKEKLRIARKRQKIVHSDETKRKIGAANSIALKGRKNPSHSIKMKGRKPSPESIEKVRQSLIGHTVSQETREKLRKSNVGQRRSAETRENLRISHLGKKQSPESIQKRMAALDLYWSQPGREGQRSQLIKRALETLKNNRIAARLEGG